MVHTGVADISPGGSSEAAPPVPIPNTVVKRFSAYDTALVTEWENRSPPGGISTHSLEGLQTDAPSQSTAPVFPAIGSPSVTSHAILLNDSGSAGLTLPVILRT